MQAYLKEAGIPTMVYYPKPMHQQLAFGQNKIYAECLVSERLCDTVLSLPIHPYIEKKDIRMIIDKVKFFLRND